MNFKKIALYGFVATAALGLSVGVAQAANVNSTQIDVTHVTSTLNTTVSNTTGDITATSAALGNSLSLTTSGDYAVLNNVQESASGVTAVLNDHVYSVTGQVSATAAAIGNSASVNLGAGGVVNNTQLSLKVDPSATARGADGVAPSRLRCTPERSVSEDPT